MVVGDLQRPAGPTNAQRQCQCDACILAVPRTQGHRSPPRTGGQRNQSDVPTGAGLREIAVPYLDAAFGVAPAAGGQDRLQQGHVFLGLERLRRLADAADRGVGAPGFAFFIDVGSVCGRFQHRKLLLAAARHPADVVRLPAAMQIQQQHVFACSDLARVEFLGDDGHRHAGRQPHAENVFAPGIKRVTRFVFHDRRALTDELELLRGDFPRRDEPGLAHPSSIGPRPFPDRRHRLRGVDGW